MKNILIVLIASLALGAVACIDDPKASQFDDISYTTDIGDTTSDSPDTDAPNGDDIGDVLVGADTGPDTGSDADLDVGDDAGNDADDDASNDAGDDADASADTSTDTGNDAGDDPARGPLIVDLGTAGDYVILASTGISATVGTTIVGDIGVSPIASPAISGAFALAEPPTTFTTSPIVTGKVYAANFDAPTPDNLLTAIGAMATAFTDAAGRATPDFVEHGDGTGDIDGLDLEPGLYKWSTGVEFANDLTLTGGANDVWIFQVAGNLLVGSDAIVTLAGNAQAKNVFWQVAGNATLGSHSDFKGILICMTEIVMQTGAKFHGRALTQTAVTLDANTVTQP
ncbi:MAG: DUF3494 domain-containing protein [Bradymonadaceae bacterium]|nr:DUF3494 domain-containing protein [Lujinxingiaceae bacterium]